MSLISLAHFTIMKAGPLELIELAARAGFDAVGIRIQPPMAADPITSVTGDAQMQRAIKSALRDTGMALLDVEAFWLMPDTDMDEFLAGIETGAELGASHAIVVGNDPDRARSLDRFASFCEHAKLFNLTPMLEFIPYTQVRTLPEAHAFLMESGADNAGLLIDALHLSRTGGTPADLAKYDPQLFRYAHICDAPAIVPPVNELRHEARSERLYPGEGGLWLDDFVRAFPAGAPFAIEAPAAKHAALGLAEQADLAQSMTRKVVETALQR